MTLSDSLARAAGNAAKAFHPFSSMQPKPLRCALPNRPPARNRWVRTAFAVASFITSVHVMAKEAMQSHNRKRATDIGKGTMMAKYHDGEN